MRRDAVLTALCLHRDDLRRDWGVSSLALFGSTARDEAGPDSDVDLLVEFDRPIGLFDLVGAQQQIEGLLGVGKVDLILRDGVIPELRDDIYGEAIVVFQAEKVEVPSSTHAGGGGEDPSLRRLPQP